MTEYADTQACFDAVKSQRGGRRARGSLQHYLADQPDEFLYLQRIPISGISYDLCAAVRKDDQMLCSILNKGIAATKGDFIGIATKDTLPKMISEPRFQDPAGHHRFRQCPSCPGYRSYMGDYYAGKRQKERTAVLAAQAETETETSGGGNRKNTDDRNRFFANISHDMRTPLNAVLGFASLAQKTISRKKPERIHFKIQMSGSLLLELINDTLTLSKRTAENWS